MGAWQPRQGRLDGRLHLRCGRRPCVWLVSTPRSARPTSADFIGLASPAAAALVAGTVWAFSDFEIQGAKVAFLVALLVAAAGVLMVSNIRGHSFMDLDLRGRVAVRGDPYRGAGLRRGLYPDPPRILLLLFLAYAASGPVQYLLQLRRRKQPS